MTKCMAQRRQTLAVERQNQTRSIGIDAQNQGFIQGGFWII